MTTLMTFGDSILDCGHYNAHGVTPGGLIVRNDDRLFPDFRGRDLSARGPTTLVHRAQDGARVGGLARQIDGVEIPPGAIVIVTVGGNDLLGGLLRAGASAVAEFEATLSAFARRLPAGSAYFGNVYDPTFGDDARNVFGIDAAQARAAHRRVDNAIARVAASVDGTCVDLHGHFLTGDPSWMVRTIEPSLRGASEVRRAFLDAILS